MRHCVHLDGFGRTNVEPANVRWYYSFCLLLYPSFSPSFGTPAARTSNYTDFLLPRLYPSQALFSPSSPDVHTHSLSPYIFLLTPVVQRRRRGEKCECAEQRLHVANVRIFHSFYFIKYTAAQSLILDVFYAVRRRMVVVEVNKNHGSFFL